MGFEETVEWANKKTEPASYDFYNIFVFGAIAAVIAIFIVWIVIVTRSQPDTDILEDIRASKDGVIIVPAIPLPGASIPSFVPDTNHRKLKTIGQPS